MVAAPSSSARPPTFTNVADLGPHGENAAQKLRRAHTHLVGQKAPGDAARLLEVDKAAAQRDFAALERLVVSGHSLEELIEAQHSAVRSVVGWRNAAALFPLMLTWAALGYASWCYQAELRGHPGLSTTPFLSLWQQRFGGFPIPTFAETAGTSFVLLLLVLLLTAWAHRRESHAGREFAVAASLVDDAMSGLALATETSTVRPPISAQEWAEAAQRVLTETQTMIESAVKKTEQLAHANNEIAKTARTELAALQAEGKAFIEGLAQETMDLMTAVRQDQAQLVLRAAEEAKEVLQQAGTANRQLVEQQMTPLFKGFRDSLDDYRADHKVYQVSAAGMQGAVIDLTSSAGVLAGSASSYTDIASSIDQQLRLIGASQSEFVVRITGMSEGMTAATEAMREVTRLMTGSMRGDLEALARSVLEAAERHATVNRDLARTSATLAVVTDAMQSTGPDLSKAAHAASAASAAAADAASRAAAAAAAAAQAAADAQQASALVTPARRPRWWA